ncbi:hypothetical protein QBC46DRAFT_342988 [Diplogelasinospora grovesii]|uniref:CBM1 domain-containing protein n=1 Tax=Diplogelasinospora grovesii TaxID=303347 RepID=A0AAN6N4J8_9PEZI|nr:hypothetical protein QBC46DRAFT_342988 [Diplogelasinospora grovesii]
MKLSISVTVLVAAVIADAQNDIQTEWGQCGGAGQWYSQCVPIGSGSPPDTTLSWIPDDPLQTTGDGAPGTVTTIFTFLTPTPTPTGAAPSIIVISGTTYSLIPGPTQGSDGGGDGDNQVTTVRKAQLPRRTAL